MTYKRLLNRRTVILGAGAGLLCAPSLARAQAETQSVALIMVGASWCPVCKQAAPMLAVFAERYGVPVMVVSHDDKQIAPFETYVSANQHPIAGAIERFPTTLIYSNYVNELVVSIEGYRNPRWYLGQLRNGTAQAEALSFG